MCVVFNCSVCDHLLQQPQKTSARPSQEGDPDALSPGIICPSPTSGVPILFGQVIRKDSDAGRDWGQEEKGMTEDKMSGWHHRLNGHEFDAVSVATNLEVQSKKHLLTVWRLEGLETVLWG